MYTLPELESLTRSASRPPTLEVLGETLAALVPIPGRTPSERLVRIAPALEALADRTSDVRRHLAEVLPAVTGFHRRMIDIGLDIQCARLAPDAVVALMAGAHPRLQRARARTAIVQAGNVPVLGALDIVVALAAGDPVALKTASAEPVSALVTAQLARAASGVECAASFGWRGGDEARERMLFEWCERLVVYGHEKTIERISAARPRTCELITFGHRISVAWIPRSGSFALEEIADRLAADVVMWDQQGCLSPHVAFVDGERDAVELGERLAAALDRFARTLPRGARTLDERAATRAWMSRFDARSARESGGTARLWQGERGEWVVALDPSGPPLVSPLGRAISIRPVRDEPAFLAELESWRGRVQAVGIGDEPGRHEMLVEPLRALGVSRVAALGRMQEPGASWVGEERTPGGALRLSLERETHGVFAPPAAGSRAGGSA